MNGYRRLVPESERDELSQIIRSIIDSNGNKMTIRSLIKEYKELTESDLPLDQFGYDTAYDLIDDMYETFGIEVNDKHRHPNDYFVYCLQTDNNTKHIVDFVQNQKQSKDRDIELINPFVVTNGCKSKSQNRRSKLIKPFKLVVTTEEDNNGNSFIQKRNQRNQLHGSNYTTVRKAVCPLPDSRLITIEEKMRIMSAIRHYGSVLLSNFGVIYHLYHKFPLDISKYGFKTMDAFLQQLPDLVGFKSTERGLVVFDVSQERNKQINGTQINGHSNGSTDNKHINNGMAYMNGNHRNSDQSLNEILMILRKNPNGIPIHRLIANYHKTYGKPLISDYWGYASPVEMFSHMKDIFYMKPPMNGSKNLEEHLLLETTPEMRTNLVKTVRKKPTIVFDETFKEKVTKVVQKAKQIYLSDFNVAFGILYGESIDPKMYGFNDLNKLLTSLSTVCNFDIKERSKSKPFAVYNKKF